MKAWSFQAPGVWITARGVVFANTEDEARSLVYAALLIAAGKTHDPLSIDITELEQGAPCAYVLFDGDL